MLYRYGQFVARRARLLLSLSALGMIAALVLGLGAFSKLKAGGFDDPNSDSSQAAQLIDANFGGQNNLVLLLTAAGTVDDPDSAAAGRALTNRIATEAGVTEVASYWSTEAPSLKSTDGRQALLVGHINGDDDQILQTSRSIVDRYSGTQGPLTVRAGGAAGANVDVNTQVTRSLAIAEAIAVPLTLLLLVFAFGSLVSALLPLVIGGLAILGTFAELAILGQVTDVSIFAINLTTALGLGLGIDYALFMVSRFREQLAAGESTVDAVATTVSTAGRTIIFSALTVAAALAAMLVFPLYFLRSFGYAGIGVVLVAALSALVVAPALLAVLGPRINAGKLPWTRAAQGAASPWWGRLAGAVMRRPARAALPVLVLLLALAAPLIGVRFGTPDPGVLHTSSPSRQVADAITTNFAGDIAAPIDIISTGPVADDAAATYAAAVSRLNGVATVAASTGVYAAGNQIAPGIATYGRVDSQRFVVTSTLAAKSDQAQSLVRQLRASGGPGGVPVVVGGEDARFIDTVHAIAGKLPLAIGLIVLTTFLVLFLFTGSVVQPLRALVLGAISLAATLGALTWMFQDGHGSSIFGYTARPMDVAMTVLLFCVTFGLSMDYEVFVVSRIKELHDRGAAAIEAVPAGLSRTGRLVSTAAGLLAVSFFAFATGTVSFLQMFGIGCGLAILIDATLVRGVLLPAAMRVLGRAAWYSPAPLRRLYRRVALAEA